MSLDISLYEKKMIKCECGKEHTLSEDCVFDTNITHNLNTMADKAGIYYALWRPEEIKAKYAKDIIQIVKTGLNKLKANPTHFKQFNSPNGWGMYKHFVPFVEEYLEALEEYPNSEIYVSS